jgi:Lon protease-like protein
MSDRLPMFPLATVLVPHGIVTLHVFEPRYRVLMFDCLRGDREFGVVLIERGSEVGGHDQRFGVATVARIAQAAELPDGRWFLVAVGTRRVGVVEWLADDPYPVALVDERTELPWPATAPEEARQALASAEQAVRQTLALAVQVAVAEADEIEEDAEEALATPLEFSAEPGIAAWQLLAVAPLAALDKQRLLAVDDHVERLGRLKTLAEDQSFLLAHRLNRE